MSDALSLYKEHLRARDTAQAPPAFEQVWAQAQRRAASGISSSRPRASAWRWAAVPLAALGVALLLLWYRTDGGKPGLAPSLEHDMALASAMSPNAFFSSPTDVLVKGTRFRAPEVMPRTGFKNPFKESFL